MFPLANQLGGQGKDSLRVLLGQNGRSGGDLADDRHTAYVRKRAVRLRGLAGQAHRTGLHGIAAQQPLLFQTGQVPVHGGRGAKAHGLTDFADGGRVAARSDDGFDVGENPFLRVTAGFFIGHDVITHSFAERNVRICCFHYSIFPAQKARKIKHMFPFMGLEPGHGA